MDYFYKKFQFALTVNIVAGNHLLATVAGFVTVDIGCGDSVEPLDGLCERPENKKKSLLL